MRFMVIVKANKESEAGVMPEDRLIAEMGRFHEELAKAGVLIDAAGLQASSKGWRIHYSGNERSVVDGPFPETKELIAGYTIIRTKTREEAIAWTKRYPNPAPGIEGASIEVRQFFEIEDFVPGEGTETFRKLDIPGNAK
ncbi:MAG TPA: YciI family protein [Candidatus Polarisedimenticolia bacterium]|nr:YciI family protein [Candidatus Polarisedimenticolia bacterium]